MLATVGFDDEAVAHEKVDAPHARNHHLSLQADSGGPQSQSDHRLRTRLAFGITPLGKVQARKTRRCHNRFRVCHVNHPVVQHRVQHDDQPLLVKTVRRGRGCDFYRVNRTDNGWIQTVGVARANSGTRPACSRGVADVQSGIGNPYAAQAQRRHTTQYTPSRDGAHDMRIGGRTGVPTPPHRSPTLRGELLDLRVRPSCSAQLRRGHDPAICLEDAFDLRHRSIGAHNRGRSKGRLSPSCG